jgi:arylsulfatase A-like enzyme
MPLLYEFAKKHCRIFENARATSTWGTPSHATMLTGLLQSEHGVEYDDSIMPIEIEMIQEKLRKNGYTTAAVVCGSDLGADSGFDRGFESFHTVGADLNASESGTETFAQRRSRRWASIDEAEHFLNNHPARPVFLYIQTNAVRDYWLDAFPRDAQLLDEIEPEETGQSLRDRFNEETSTDRKRYLYSTAVRRLDECLCGIHRSFPTPEY